MTVTASTTGYRPTAIETGGIEAIPSEHRHGSPWQLLATWSAPNFEFATVFVGMLAVGVFGLNFWQALAAVILGNGLGAIAHGVLSTWGPREGLAQLVLSRTAFGLRGNIAPAGLNTIMAGLGWFATNSVSGALALNVLFGIPAWLALLVVVIAEVAVAFVGHDLVQLFERYASIALCAVFVLATVTVISHADLGKAAASHGSASVAGFTIIVSAAFGYAAGWTPYASDYTRYLPASTPANKVAVAAGLGNFLSCTVLMAGGAAAALIAYGSNPTESYVSSMPSWLRDLTLIAIAVGAVAANALNIYSGSMSFLAAGVKIPFSMRRAIIALGFGFVGFWLALAAVLNADFGTQYENFLLVIAYWIAPWLAIVLVDRYLRRGTSIAEFIPDHAKYRNPAGIAAFLVSILVSVLLFSNQVFYLAPLPKHVAWMGDLTPLVGFLLAGGLYYALFQLGRPAVGGPLGSGPATVIGVDAADDIA